MSKNKPAKGKDKFKMVKGKNGRMRKVSYGQKGVKVSPGTAKGNSFCARTAKIKGNWKKDRNSPNAISRRRWHCQGKYSRKSLETETVVDYLTDNQTIELSLVKATEYPKNVLLGDDGKFYEFSTESTLQEYTDDITKSLDDEVLFDDEAIRLEDLTGTKYFYNKDGLYKDMTFYDEMFMNFDVIDFKEEENE